MAELPPELASLPAPGTIEIVSFDARLSVFRARLMSLFQTAGIPYDVEELEADPVQIVLQAASYNDVLLRQRVNEAVRANLLAFATGGDLDQLAVFYDVFRNVSESDEQLRKRVVLAIRGRSTGGTEPRYRSVALGVSTRVADAAVYTVGKDPTVHVAVFSSDNAGVADASLLAQVNAALHDPQVRMVNDRIEVAAASRMQTGVTANVWLLPAASDTLLAQMKTALNTAWREAMVLGRDVTRSWLTAKLMVEGVHRIEIVSPVSDVEVPFNQVAALGTVTLNNMGRAY